MNRYERVLEILDNATGGPQNNIGEHGAFWRGKTRAAFVAYRVFDEVQLLVVGDGKGANLVKALKGEAPFDGSVYPQMPFGFAPVAPSDIAFIERWIQEGCLEDPFTPPVAADFSAFRWRETKAPHASSRTDDVSFIDPLTGWAVNSNGNIIHTTDGGESDWAVQLHVPGGYLRCAAMASATRGWVGAISPPDKVLYETRDGQTWQLVTNLPAMAPVAVCGLWVLDEQTVFAAGSNHPENPVRMMKTVDGGANWTAWDMRKWADNLIDVYFTTPLRGWTVGGKSDQPVPAKENLKPVVLYTEDGGATWVDRLVGMRDQFPLGEWGWKIHFVDERVGFISLQNYFAGAILATTDGGVTWQRRPINDPQKNANLEGIGFLNAQHGWVGGWGDQPKQKRTSSESFDGGLTWRDANEIGRTINRFRFIGNPIEVGYSSGETVYKYAPAPTPASPATLTRDKEQTARLLDSTAPLEQSDRVEFPIEIPSGVHRLSVRIWDQFGALARTLLDVERPAAGRSVLLWDGSDSFGRFCPDGHFIWRVTADDLSESRLVLFRRTNPLLRAATRPNSP